ncbi:MAG: hypothetical protein AAFO95_15170 [Cyanobacteria bacterium J06600_6]
MSRQIRRLHRKKTEFTNFSASEPSVLPNPVDSTEHSIGQNSAPTPLTNSSFSNGSNDINTIRAELREDTYHSELAESDFTDDTHDWGGDSENYSSDYWHFVGSFE